jgi:hypothetical protein
MRLAVRELAVEVLHHREHRARCGFRRNFVGREIGRNMAIGAHHAQASGRLAHGAADEFFFSEDLEVLSRAASASTPTARAASTTTGSRGLSILRAEGQGENSEKKEKFTHYRSVYFKTHSTSEISQCLAVASIVDYFYLQ